MHTGEDLKHAGEDLKHTGEDLKHNNGGQDRNLATTLLS